VYYFIYRDGLLLCMAKTTEKQKESIASVLLKYKNDSTRAGYRNSIESFLRCMYHLPKKDASRKKVVYDYETLLSTYLSDKRRNTSKDFEEFSECLMAEATSVLSARQIMTFARKFLSRFNVKVNQNAIQDLKRNMKGSAATINKSMTGEVIDKALKEMDLRGRALVLTLASSGMRLNEALALTDKDVDFEASPVVVHLRGENTKTKQYRYTFLSNEAGQCLKAWLEKRDDYLVGASGRNKALVSAGRSGVKNAHSNRVFPFSDNAANLVWETALKASGQFSVDERTGRNQLRIHSFRAFFITQLSMASQKVLAESLAGHQGYLDGAYRQIPMEQAAPLYKSIMHVVTIGIPPEFREKATELNGKLQLQGESIEGLRAMNEKLTIRMTKMQDEIESLKEKETRRTELLEYIDQYPDLLQILKKVVSSEGNND